jgi:hypothetical protein
MHVFVFPAVKLLRMWRQLPPLPRMSEPTKNIYETSIDTVEFL